MIIKRLNGAILFVPSKYTQFTEVQATNLHPLFLFSLLPFLLNVPPTFFAFFTCIKRSYSRKKTCCQQIKLLICKFYFVVFIRHIISSFQIKIYKLYQPKYILSAPLVEFDILSLIEAAFYIV